MTKVTNILLAGVGGQGTLLASEVLSEVLMLAGYDVKKNEIHGMSQRGGSVSSHVRFGEHVHSPIIPEGETDILFGFELLETYRNLPLLKKGGAVITNNLKLMPPSVATGQERYPEGLEELICQQVEKSQVVDGLALAMEAGNPRTVNIVLLGALSTKLDLTAELWQQAIRKMVPKKFLEENLRAFELGRQAA
ncbi:indolepyruvate oxidoreductase subunit beta [uncultured Desulfuromonas sp.]|uniref:indolepyruvate oxidoreductase subunit beta n=1 Tax=uncultured Desulfuromonas sp. TaxID=181013 RepID=UPI002AABCACF|nr:indolepyruvate oxidoreductase subunit beta [uncultured Desulfuromonas sp.]